MQNLRSDNFHSLESLLLHRKVNSMCFPSKKDLKEYSKNNFAYLGLRYSHHKKRRIAIIEILAPLQENNCWLCKTDLHLDINIDHDHKTGFVRGLVHNCCNLNIDIQIDEQKYSPFPVKEDFSELKIIYDSSFFVT